MRTRATFCSGLLCVLVAGAGGARGAPPAGSGAGASPGAGAPGACAAAAPAAPAAPTAPAAPRPTIPSTLTAGARARHKARAAAAQYASGNYQRALELIEEGLEAAPKDLQLLGLRGAVLLELRDYRGALGAYRAYLAARPHGINRREAQKIVSNLQALESTTLELTLANGPGEVYLDSKGQGPFCTAAPTCRRAALPGRYRVIVERPGFGRWSQPVEIRKGEATRLEVTLAEEPSPLTVRVTPAGARVSVDGQPFDPSRPLSPGPHDVRVGLAGFAEERRGVVAREGKPLELAVALTPVVPVQVEPAGAELLLDGRPAPLQDGGLALPPGAHQLAAHAPGFEARDLTIPAERDPDYRISVRLAPRPAARPARPSPAPRPSEPGLLTGRRKLALAVIGAGAAALGTGITLGLQSRRLDADTYALCEATSLPCLDAPEANELNHRARARALEANLAYGAAAAAGVTAAVLWLTGAPERRVAVTPHLDPHLGAAAGLDLSVRF